MEESVVFCEELKKDCQRDWNHQSLSIIDSFDFGFKSFRTPLRLFPFDTKGNYLEEMEAAWLDRFRKVPLINLFLSGGIGLEEMPAVNEILNTNLPITHRRKQ
jgi:phosphoribosylanthranilate isomerase